MAAKKQSKPTSSRPVSGRPSPDGASIDTAQKPEAPSKAARANPHAIDPGAAKLYSPVGPLMWLLIPFVLCIAIMLLKR
jgi:hypothetical protein